MTAKETENINDQEVIRLLNELKSMKQMGESTKVDEQEISIGELWRIFKNHLVTILIVALICGGVGFIISKLLITPLYTSAVTLYVASNDNMKSDTAAGAQSEYRYTTEVINTYIQILKTESFFDDVARATLNKYTAKDLEKKITVQAIPSTEVIKITVVTDDPNDSYFVATAFAGLSSGKIESIKSEHQVKIVDPPKIAEKPSNDKSLLNTAIGILLGAMISYITFLMKSIMDKTIKYPEDLTERFRYPILGIIPDLSAGKKTKENEEQTEDKYNFATKEAYKSLRTNLGFAFTGTGGKIMAITSSIPSEGKTTTATNIAKAIAQIGAKTIIVDGDLRKPKVHKYFAMVNELGLSNLAAGMVEMETVIKPTKIENLDIITAGELPPNPSELLSNDITKTILKKLKNQYDYVIIDMPPIGVVSDALGVVSDIDGYIVVARSGVVEWPMLQDVLEGLEFGKAKIAGFVLNGFAESKTGKYGYKYNDKYKYKYKY